VAATVPYLFALYMSSVHFVKYKGHDSKKLTGEDCSDRPLLRTSIAVVHSSGCVQHCESIAIATSVEFLPPRICQCGQYRPRLSSPLPWANTVWASWISHWMVVWGRTRFGDLPMFRRKLTVFFPCSVEEASRFPLGKYGRLNQANTSRTFCRLRETPGAGRRRPLLSVTDGERFRCYSALTPIPYEPWLEDRMNALLANDAVLVGMALQVRQCGRKAYRYGPSAWEIINERGLCCFSASSKHARISSKSGSRSVQA